MVGHCSAFRERTTFFQETKRRPLTSLVSICLFSGVVHFERKDGRPEC